MQVSSQLESKENQPNFSPIHLIWRGSILSEKNIKQLRKWQELNPNIEIRVWVEPEFKDQIQAQLKDSKIQTHNLASLNTKESVKLFLKKLMEPRNDGLKPNPGAASDIDRLFILDQHGGWYFDFDIEPFNINNRKINKKLNFLLHGGKRERIILRTSPHIVPDFIGASKNNILTQHATMLAEKYSEELLKEDHIKFLRSNNRKIRHCATEWSTGEILIAALGTIIVDDERVWTRGSIKKSSFELFDSVTFDFEGNFEQAWLYDLKSEDTVKEPSVLNHQQLKPMTEVLNSIYFAFEKSVVTTHFIDAYKAGRVPLKKLLDETFITISSEERHNNEYSGMSNNDEKLKNAVQQLALNKAWDKLGVGLWGTKTPTSIVGLRTAKTLKEMTTIAKNRINTKPKGKGKRDQATADLLLFLNRLDEDAKYIIDIEKAMPILDAICTKYHLPGVTSKTQPVFRM